MAFGNHRVFDSATLHSLPVLAISEGRVLGKVKDEIFDPQRHVLVGLTVDGADGERFVDLERVQRLGPFAVTVRRSSDLQDLSDHERALAIVDSGIKLRGEPVLTDVGEPMGRLDKIWIDDRGDVIKYRCSLGSIGLRRSREITPDQVMVVGQDAMIVSADVFTRRSQHDRDRAPSAYSDEGTH